MAQQQPKKKGPPAAAQSSKSKSPYHEAADLLNKVLDSDNNKGGRQKNLKSLVYSKDGNLKVTTKTYAVVSKVLQHQTELRACQEAVELVQAKNPGLLLVLLYELLLSPKQSIQGGGALKRQLLKHEKALRKALPSKSVDISTRSSDPGTDSVTPMSNNHHFPRYLRVNTCLTTTARVIQELQDELHISVYVDEHVPDLLVVPPSATSQILAHDKLKHHVILQDKSSCFPALCLLPDADGPSAPGGGDILDACAAPGNKTSHLAALIRQRYGARNDKQMKSKTKKTTTTTTLFALDRDRERCQLLKERLQQLVPSSDDNDDALLLQVQHQDFLKTQPTDYPNVTGILLDPSCSGSGIYTRPENTHNEQNVDTTHRLEKLSNFQITCLKHAMSFDKVTRIVYSTCSIHYQENEAVIAACLSEDASSEWEIVAPTGLTTWKRRGMKWKNGATGDEESPTTNNHGNKTARKLTSEETSKLIRANQDDNTNGFFVGVLERKNVAKKNKKKFHNPNDTLGIPIYRGEFAHTTTMDETDPGQPQPQPQPEAAVSTRQSLANAKKRKQSADTDNKHSKDDTQQVSLLANNKKRAKKLEWKRKQHEQKMLRVTQPGSKPRETKK